MISALIILKMEMRERKTTIVRKFLSCHSLSQIAAFSFANKSSNSNPAASLQPR